MHLEGGGADQSAEKWHAGNLGARTRYAPENRAKYIQQIRNGRRRQMDFVVDRVLISGQSELVDVSEANEGITPEAVAPLHAFQ